MNSVNNNKIQFRILRAFYKLAPFNLKGNLENCPKPYKSGLLSCLIISNRKNLLKDLLEDLKLQSLSKNEFEVVIIFDGPGEGILELTGNYKENLNIIFYNTRTPVKKLSDLRNLSVENSNGEFLLFFDDDTRIFQNNFLESALTILKEGQCDILIPQAHALYGIVGAGYDYLDKFSFTTRCCFYRRNIIDQIGGFLKGLQTYEDIELSIRLMINTPRTYKTNVLNYYHPPLYFDTMNKPMAIGQSVFQTNQYYSKLVWLLYYFNALRFLPLGLFPGQRYRQWFKISWGVLTYPFSKKSYFY